MSVRDPFRLRRPPRAGRPSRVLALAALAPLAGAAPAPPAAQDGRADGAVDFTRDVYPLLQRACWECHGPGKQKGGLRLDSRDAALRGGDGGPVIVPGQGQKSELLRRISLPPEDEDIMPAKGEPLTEAEVALFRRWIDGGAEWPAEAAASKHWAYVRPVRPALPPVKDRAWPRNPVDAFVLARLEAENLSPAAEAELPVLIRRLYLDLIGLPPAPEEVDELLRDSEPGAYERLVDRLLASPQFGVRWARPWLDCARYADSHGFQADDLRDLWPYRDWVVAALNADMPFDRFTIEQLAGDLLPDATMSQRIATGFNRSSPCNVELGSDPQETRVNQVIDRVNTLGTVWLGSTLECAQCHDHKYDPFSIRDYYGVFALFNQTAIEAERVDPSIPGSIRFLGPVLRLPDPELEAEEARLKQQLDDLTRRLAERRAHLAQEDPTWEARLLETAAGAALEHVLELTSFGSLGGAAYEFLEDGSVLLSGEAPDRDTYVISARTELEGIRAFKLEVLTDPSLPGNGPGRGDPERPAFLLQSFQVWAAPAGSAGEPEPVALAGASADYSQPRLDIAGAIDDDPETAWGILSRFHEPRWARFETAQPLARSARLEFRLEQNVGGARTIGRLRLRAVVGPDGAGVSLPAEVVEVLRVPRAGRSERQRETLVDYRASQDADHGALAKERTRLELQIRNLPFPTTLVMEELEKPRPSTLFVRGDFRSPGEPIEPDVPAVLPPLRRAGAAPSASGASDGPLARGATRLDLARWLVDGENPLVARVTVNRWWAEVFGHGLVTTPEDFGIKGERPTHPELLDWLAVELMENGWSMKRWLRTVVLSATYRQSARVTPELLARDDRNLLHARGPRFRMEAEMIRDNALAIAGLLNPALGGPPIRPPQPEGQWSKIGGKVYDYVVSPGAEKYRRGLYVVWKRAAPYPSFVTFDATARMTCQVKRGRSNTPLQALALLNDPVYVEAAAGLARRVLRERPGADVDARIEHAFRLALVRPPEAPERETLRRLYREQLEAGSAESAAEFAEIHGSPEGVEPREFKAWHALATALLNLDETISK